MTDLYETGFSAYYSGLPFEHIADRAYQEGWLDARDEDQPDF